MLPRLIISAPFGNSRVLRALLPTATPTLGTFTLHRRGGLAYCLWRCLLTLRYNRRSQSWINRLGLPNPGIESLPRELGIGTADRHLADYTDRIISIKGFSQYEWAMLAWSMADRQTRFVELNLSCPNVGEQPSCDDALDAAEILLRAGRIVIAKLPPVKWLDLAVPLYDAGVRHFHACNTLPVPAGGLSGKPLKPLSLWAVAGLKQRWGETVAVIGGGGVTHESDYLDYRRAGADAVAVGSVLLNPFNWSRIRRLATQVSRE